MKQDKKTFLFGVGVGLITAATIYFVILMLTGYNHPEKNFENTVISDETIIEKAEDLGMIRLSDFLEGNYDKDVEE